MPKGTKRKREDEDDPQPRRSQRERKRASFGEDFVELFSPPKNPASSKGPSQSGPSTSSAGGGGRSWARTTHKHSYLGQFTKQVEATTSRKPS